MNVDLDVNILESSVWLSDSILIGVFRPKIWTKSCFSPIFTIFTPPHGIHGWKATDLSLDLAPSDQNLMHPTSRQNFGDGPGQTPKLILTLCHMSWISAHSIRKKQGLSSTISTCETEGDGGEEGEEGEVAGGQDQTARHCRQCLRVFCQLQSDLSIRSV